MKLPSITQIWTELVRTLARFPLTVISALVGTVVSIALIEKGEHLEASILFSILLTTVLALPLLTALRLAAEGDGSNAGRVWLLQLVGVALLVIYGLTVPVDLPRAPLMYMFRFFAFAVAACFLLSFLPFIRKGQGNGFWQFNKTIVFRSMLAGAFAVVLFSGLGLALAALDNLFGINIPPKRYFELWIMILWLFAIPFILSGIPGRLRELDEVTEYPRLLRVFGQYVLSPLVLVYFVILYAYIGKIIITWSWPQGWVGRLILGFSATGILALFILNPIREKLETLWIKRASRWYYLILLPLVVVLFLALWRRISEYGLTEDRYLGLAIGVWLAFTAFYFLFSRSKSIKMIPGSLCVLTFVISVGPWSMFAVSERSQIGRLQEMLEADSILMNGVVQEAPSPVSNEHQVEISAILSYLHQVHGYSAIQPWFAEPLRADTAGAYSWFKDPSDVAELMGIRYNPYRAMGRETYFTVFIDPQTSISLEGYDQMVQAQYGYLANSKPGNQPMTNGVKVVADSLSVILQLAGDSTAYDSLLLPLHRLFHQVTLAHDSAIGKQIPPDDATYDYETADFKTRTILLEAHFEREDSTVVVNAYQALILYSRQSED